MEYGGLASPYLNKIGPFSATGTPFSVSAGRISFAFGLKGPAVQSFQQLIPFSVSSVLVTMQTLQTSISSDLWIEVKAYYTPSKSFSAALCKMVLHHSLCQEYVHNMS